ncbi:transcriptional regulator [Desmophyllum pertusum]|uniref:Transcriptional regulator n=1 Tax=Desmophyllum pertusum TaxID=174260 RepID=A0A9W9ZMW2_9CNID|nr:transcriptional regulator [Desmophyllum pertusum]
MDADEDEVAVVNQESKPTEEGKSWTDIIPEKERRKLEEEEEQKKQLELYLPPRNRKTVKKMNYGKPNHSDSEQEENYKKRTSRKKKSESESDDDSGGEGKETKRKRGRPRTIKREDVEGFNDAEIRRFVKSYKKFGRPRTRLDAIATDAELEDKPAEDLNRLADILHNGCLRAVEEYEEKLKEDANFDGKKRGATVRLSNVTVNAPSVLKHEEELESLAAIMPADHDVRRKFRLTVPAKSVHWGVTWDVPDDSMLLVGIFEYGLGSWEAIKADQSLSLTSKILPPGTLKPQDKHLQTRVEYLIKLLKQAVVEDKAEQLRKSSQVLKSKIRLLRQKETKKENIPQMNL